MTSNLFFISGGPGTGKTSAINKLKLQGYQTIPEAAREIASKDKRFSRMGGIDRQLFQDEIFRMQKRAISTPNFSQPVFSDRGFGDTIAYYKIHNLEIPEESLIYAKNFRNSRVFMMDFLNSYETDDIRKESLEEQVDIHREIIRTYRELGNEIVFVPALTIGERVEFIKGRIISSANL